MKVWKMLVRIAVIFLGPALEGRHDGICNINLGYIETLCPLKDFGPIIHGLLYGLVQEVGYHGHLRAFGAFGVNMCLKVVGQRFGILLATPHSTMDIIRRTSIFN